MKFQLILETVVDQNEHKYKDYKCKFIDCLNILKNHILLLYASRSRDILIHVVKSIVLQLSPYILRRKLDKVGNKYIHLNLRNYKILTDVAGIHLASKIYLGIEHEAFNDFTLSKGISVVDVGAHHGNYSIKAASLGAQRVVAIEPHPENFKILSYNILLNKATNILIPLNFGISNKDRSIKLFLGRSSASSTIDQEHRYKHPEDFDGHYLIIKARKLDSLLSDLGISPDIIKIDVEGAELEVLQGAIKALNSSCLKLVVECHSKRKTIQVLRFLSEIGFKYFQGKNRTGGYTLYASKVLSNHA